MSNSEGDAMKDKGKRILVAERDDATRELIMMRLHSRPHKVFEASKSSQAVRFLDREVLDLILLSSDMEPVGGRFVEEPRFVLLRPAQSARL